jgi:hypothetical protein
MYERVDWIQVAQSEYKLPKMDYTPQREHIS